MVKFLSLQYLKLSFFVVLTWGVAFYYNFYYYLFVPLVLTPFLMLKTSESIQMSHTIFLYEIDSHPSFKKITFSLSAFISLLLIIIIWDQNQEYWINLLVFIIIFLLILVSIILILTSNGKNAIEKSVNDFVRDNKLISIISSSFLAVFFYITGKMDFSEAISMLLTATLFAFFWTGITSGFFLVFRSLIIKLFVTLNGIFLRPIYTSQHISNNWYEQVFVNDTFYTPELLPEISQYNSDFQLIGLIRNQSGNKKYSEKFFRYILACFWSLTYLYRWSIKSTAWFYWPLAFVFNKKPLEDKTKGKTYIDDQTNSLTLNGYIVIGAILGIYFMGSSISLDKLENFEPSVGIIIELFQSISIKYPFIKTIIHHETWWLVLSATIIYFIIYRFSSLQQHRRAHNNPEYSKTFNTTLHWFIRLKNVLWVAFFAINLFFIANQHVWPLIFNFF